MRPVRIYRAAAQEAVAAAAWYELQRPGLGNVMRLMLRRFPYDIVVVDRGDDILVLAVAHHSRRPGYWRDRQSVSQIQDVWHAGQYPETVWAQEVEVTPVRYAIVFENAGGRRADSTAVKPRRLRRSCRLTGSSLLEQS